MNLKRITVLSPSFALTSIVAIASALAKIAEAFPDVSVSAVQLLTAIPSLVAIVVILFSGYFASWITKKRIVTISMALMLIGGLLPIAFHTQFYHLVISSVIFGLGYGGISPLTTALINEHYSQDEQPTMLCFQSAVIGIGGVLFSYLGGKLASICWWYAYYSYLLFIPILLLVLFLPTGRVNEQIRGDGFLNFWTRQLAFYIIQSLIFGIFFFTFQNNIALLMESRALGGAETAGTILSIQSAFGIISGVLGGKLLEKLDKMSLPVIFLVSAIGLLIIFLSESRMIIYFASACLGFVFSLRMPAGYLKATSSVAPSYVTMAITIYCSSSQAGQFLSPLCVNWICGMLSLTLNQKFLLSGIALLIFGVLSIIWERTLVRNP